MFVQLVNDAAGMLRSKSASVINACPLWLVSLRCCLSKCVPLGCMMLTRLKPTVWVYVVHLTFPAVAHRFLCGGLHSSAVLLQGVAPHLSGCGRCIFASQAVEK